MTGNEALRAATLRLGEAGVEGAARDARWLLAHALGLPPDRLVARLADPLTPAEAERFEAALAARAARQPVAQITGRRAFWGRTFRVTPDVLDPRADTETLIALALAEPFERVADLGTGSGCLLLTLLAERPEARGIGTDISSAALEVARHNASGLGVADRAEFRPGSWYEPLAETVDLIVSNPPYIAAGEMAVLEPEVRDWEPRQALTDEGDGLSAYRAIAGGALKHLVPGGRLIVETGAGQGAAVAGLFAAAGLESVACHPDLEGRQRAVSARSP